MLIKRKKGIFCKKIYEEFSSSWEKFLFLKILSILQASILKKKNLKLPWKMFEEILEKDLQISFLKNSF